MIEFNVTLISEPSQFERRFFTIHDFNLKTEPCGLAYTFSESGCEMPLHGFSGSRHSGLRLLRAYHEL